MYGPGANAAYIWTDQHSASCECRLQCDASGVKAMVHASIAGEALLFLYVVLGTLGLSGVPLLLLLQTPRNSAPAKCPHHVLHAHIS